MTEYKKISHLFKLLDFIERAKKSTNTIDNYWLFEVRKQLESAFEGDSKSAKSEVGRLIRAEFQRLENVAYHHSSKLYSSLSGVIEVRLEAPGLLNGDALNYVKIEELKRKIEVFQLTSNNFNIGEQRFSSYEKAYFELHFLLLELKNVA